MIDSKIILQFDPITQCYAVYVYGEYNNKRLVALPVNFTFKEVELGNYVHPTFHLSTKQVTELAEQLDKEHIKTDNDHKIQGILEAQGLHLADMRAIVYNQLNIGDTK